MRFLILVNFDTKMVMLEVYPEDSAKVFTHEMPASTAIELRDQLTVALKRLEN